MRTCVSGPVQLNQPRSGTEGNTNPECGNNAEQAVLEATKASPPAKRFELLAKRLVSGQQVEQMMNRDNEIQRYRVELQHEPQLSDTSAGFLQRSSHDLSTTGSTYC